MEKKEKGLFFLSKKKDIEQVIKQGGRVRFGCLCMYSLPQQMPYLRVALSFSAKCTQSVVRNRLKRWSRKILMDKAKLWKKTGRNNVFWDIILILHKRDKSFYREMRYERFYLQMEGLLEKGRIFKHGD